MLWFLLQWWTFAGVAFVLDLAPGPVSVLINVVVGFAGAYVSTRLVSAGLDLLRGSVLTKKLFEFHQKLRIRRRAARSASAGRAQPHHRMERISRDR